MDGGTEQGHSEMAQQPRYDEIMQPKLSQATIQLNQTATQVC